MYSDASRDQDNTLEPAPELKGLRTLIVEDEDDSRDLLEAILLHYGASVTPCASAGAALAALEVARFDVILSDIGMPGQDGFQFIEAVRALPDEQGGRTPAAALTAYARAEDRMRAFNAGFQLHIPKPIDPAELVIAVAALAGAPSSSDSPFDASSSATFSESSRDDSRSSATRK